MESVYWVFTLKCNDHCAHCYNSSGPKGETIGTEELLRVVPNLPPRIGRIILSGGEPLIELEKLKEIVAAIRRRFEHQTQIFLQTNGDLLTEETLAALELMTIDRIDVVSIDRFHRQKGKHIDALRSLFLEKGWSEKSSEATGETTANRKIFSFWGASDGYWVGGLWARGRAKMNKLGNTDPTKNFCSQWSGAIGFLDEGSAQQEVHIQLYRLYPCCPTTLYSMGDVRERAVNELLEEARNIETFRKLNLGDVQSVGTESGLTKDHIRSRINALGDVCLWCDEFFETHYSGPRGERRK